MPIATTDGSMTLRAWTVWMLACTVAMSGLVAVFNAVVDPTAQLGAGILEPVAAGPQDREAKVALLRDPRPSLVVLGSSRTKKLNPAWLPTAGDAPAVNAAVVGGDMFEARVLTALLAQSRSVMPQLVIGVDVEQLRDSSLHGSGFLALEQTAAVARQQASGSSGSAPDEVRRLQRLLLTWQTTKASLAAVRGRLASTQARAAAPVTAAAAFTATGVPVGDAKWSGEQIERFAKRTPGKVAASINEYEATYASIGSKLDADAIADLRALIELVAGAGGPPPLLYITPSHPDFIEAFDDDGQRERHQNVAALLDELAASGDAISVDCLRCIDDAPASWIDAVHPSPVGARQLAARLSEAL